MEPVKQLKLWLVTTCALALLLSAIATDVDGVSGHNDHTCTPRVWPIKVECGEQSYEENSTFAGYVDRTKDIVKNQAPSMWPSGPGQIFRFPYQEEYIGQIKYRAACRASATMKSQEDCRLCLQQLTDALGKWFCVRKKAAGVYSPDCFVRWLPPNTPFGKQISPWEKYV